MSYHPNRKSYHNKLSQFNQRTITLNKRNNIILIKEMRSKKNRLNPTPNIKSIRIFKKINVEYISHVFHKAYT